ncbi:hypothetical protein HAHE_42430 [Haloferula helveola]|uniref:AsmA-like C-terminal domain-containing protein n=1 Tax=Haloferula helveola TaxID=490095 RepID=A0ABN6H9I5_9BACT|nr:hypothetical protein HAHE_42430 [Haloferula helveola]
MEAEKSQEFNQRLSQWIASQGFWFQLRHSMSSGGGWSITLFHLLRMAFRVLIVVALIGLLFFYYLVKRVNTGAFQTQIRSGFEKAVEASDAKLLGFRRIQGQAMVRRVGATGTPESFFQSMEAGNLVFNMGMLDGLTQKWEAGVIQMNWLDMELRAGANSEEEASAAAGAFFANHPGFELRGLDVNNARLSWGYFERAYGGITGSKLLANRTANGWRLSFTGGTFSQNWIRRFEIQELVMFCSRDGLVVEKGVLKAGKGTVTFDGVKVSGGELPELSGDLVFEHIPLSALLPNNAQEVVSGTISGRFALGGSTNSAGGVTLNGKVDLDGEDMISVRSGLHLLEALDVVDVFNSYKRVDFDQGDFEVDTQSGTMTISQLNLEARGLMTVQGRITVRRPDAEELEKQFGITDGLPGVDSGLDAKQESELQISLKNAGEASKASEPEEGADPETSRFFSDMADTRRLRREAMDRARNLYLFDGGVRMMIPGDAFERSRILRERFPVDQSTGKIGIDVPLEGTLANLTLKQAEEILRLSSDE